jgi:hypothetical protein
VPHPRRSRRLFARSVFQAASVTGVFAATGVGRAVAEEPARDLLRQIELPRDALAGTWRKAGDAVIFDGDTKFARLVLPGSVPQAYRLSLTVTRESGNEIFVLGLVAGGNTAAVLIDGWRGGVSGIDKIDGRSGENNASTHRGFRFSNGTPTKIECIVNAGLIRVSCNGLAVIEWRGDFSALSSVDGWKVPGGKSLFVGAWKPSRFRIEGLTLTPLSVVQEAPAREPVPTALAPPR